MTRTRWNAAAIRQIAAKRLPAGIGEKKNFRIDTAALCRGICSRRSTEGLVAGANEIRTDRLLLRRWRRTDLEPFAAMCADERVMKHFPALLTREECDAGITRIETHFDKYGFGFWAVEVPQIAPFIGFVGLRVLDYATPFTPAVEIGWRLAAEHWNHGYATEAARSALKFGFETMNLP